MSQSFKGTSRSRNTNRLRSYLSQWSRQWEAKADLILFRTTRQGNYCSQVCFPQYRACLFFHRKKYSGARLIRTLKGHAKESEKTKTYQLKVTPWPFAANRFLRSLIRTNFNSKCIKYLYRHASRAWILHTFVTKSRVWFSLMLYALFFQKLIGGYSVSVSHFKTALCIKAKISYSVL